MIKVEGSEGYDKGKGVKGMMKGMNERSFVEGRKREGFNNFLSLCHQYSLHPPPVR